MKMLKVPDRCQTKEMLIGTMSKLENAQHIVVLIEDDDGGVWSMTVNGTTVERINWMLDRAKLMLHDAD